MTRWRVQFCEVWRPVVLDAPTAVDAIVIAASFVERAASRVVSDAQRRTPHRIEVVAALDYRDGAKAPDFE